MKISLKGINVSNGAESIKVDELELEFGLKDIKELFETIEGMDRKLASTDGINICDDKQIYNKFKNNCSIMIAKTVNSLFNKYPDTVVEINHSYIVASKILQSIINNSNVTTVNQANIESAMLYNFVTSCLISIVENKGEVTKRMEDSFIKYTISENHKERLTFSQNL